MDRREAGSAASGTRDLADEELTETVLASFEDSRLPRFKEIMQSLIRHLHAFVSEVGLTEEEWFRAIDFLTRTGHISDDKPVPRGRRRTRPLRDARARGIHFQGGLHAR